MDLVFEQIFKAINYLFIAGLIFIAYSTTKGAKGTTKQKLWKGFLSCVGIAFFASLIMGQPSCIEQDDPIRGGCLEYADKGFDPTMVQRISQFAYFMTLLYIPVIFGALRGNKDK